MIDKVTAAIEYAETRLDSGTVETAEFEFLSIVMPLLYIERDKENSSDE